MLPVLLGMLLLLTACKSGEQVVQPNPDPVIEAGAVRLADYEEFDPRPYREDLAPPPIDIEHDVPERLLEGRAARGFVERVQGYRIQVVQTIDKRVAVRREGEVKAWLRNDNDNRTMPVYMHFHQPYYRVRVGDFATRDEAEEALEMIGTRFPGAFIAPDIVTVVR